MHHRFSPSAVVVPKFFFLNIGLSVQTNVFETTLQIESQEILDTGICDVVQLKSGYPVENQFSIPSHSIFSRFSISLDRHYHISRC
ncbi:uncharacterized protein PHALS_15033 [Plasmopara halstedii]|uniref:Uncharacterized protein n=1 Tax=Plasmopara halstedii TaxID=4781 RepID=A0A0P1A906_PLAHL|nr:uncharacterized protein PHALS_15033 [Plasmopara halstedii]CEG37175.1 hypothetical protein PHALS_15033 [Plasmopara halstedii]|eukprot:XP_024573544.1 hypothetical protein PHALS_15033 [Plasmopara halstedii]